LGGTYCNLGNLIRDDGRPEGALPWYAQAISTLQGVWAQDRRLVTAQRFLRNAHWGRAEALARLGRHAEAAPDWGRASELDEGPARLWFRLRRAACWAEAGDHARAVAEANSVTEEKGVPPAIVYDAARVFSLSAKAAKSDVKLCDQYATRAVKLLAKVRDAVLFKDPEAVEHAKQDPDLAPLHGREDFKKLMAQIEAELKKRPVAPAKKEFPIW
jgi:hypothetical protein